MNETFNRTILELKPVSFQLTRRSPIAFNRTILELKPFSQAYNLLV